MALINCPECGKEISDQAEVCPNCGIRLKTQTKFCKHCGASIDADCVVCPECGKQVEQLKSDDHIVINNTNQNTNVNTNVNTVVLPTVSPKRRVVALLLCLFLGFFGAHRFYVGKIGTGILMFLLMFTGIGEIWLLVDFIYILIGSFTDKAGFKVVVW